MIVQIELALQFKPKALGSYPSLVFSESAGDVNESKCNSVSHLSLRGFSINKKIQDKFNK